MKRELSLASEEAISRECLLAVAGSGRVWRVGGSLTMQLPHRDAWALGLCTLSTGQGGVCASSSSSKQESRGKW